MRAILTPIFLLSLLFTTTSPGMGQSDKRENFYLDVGTEYNRTAITGNTLDGGSRAGYTIAFNGLRRIPLGSRFDLELGIGGSIRRLVQYVENVDRSGRGDLDLVSIDMTSDAISLQVPVQARYYFRPGRRGLFLRAGALIIGELKEDTDYYINRDIESAVDYSIRNAVRNGFNPLWRIGIGHQYVGDKFDTHYVELYFLSTTGRSTAQSYRNEIGWVNYWQPARYYSIGLSIGGVLGKKKKP